MPKYHAVMIGECREEFGVTIEAADRNDAYAQLEDDYPESRVDTLSDERQMADREQRLNEWAQKCYDDPYYEIDHGHEWGQ